MRKNLETQYKVSTSRLSYLFPQFWFGSWMDAILTLVGFLAAILSGFCVPGTIILYGNLAEIFIQYQILMQIKNTTEIKEYPVGFRRLIGTFKGTPEELAKQTTDFAMFSVLLAIGQLVFTSTFVLCLNQAALNQSIWTREAHFKALLRQKISWFDSQNSKDLVSKSIRDMSYLQAGLGEKLGMFVSSTVAACACILVALYYGFKLAGILLIVVPIIVIINYVAKQTNEFMKKQECLFYKLAESTVEESLQNIRSVSAYSGESYESKKYVERLTLVEDCEVTKGTINGIIVAVLWTLLYCMYGLAFWYGVELLRTDQSYTVASLIVVFFCIQIGVLHILQLPQYLYIIAKSKAASEKITHMQRQMSKAHTSTNLDDFDVKTKQIISFNNVTFSYPTNVDNLILKGVSLNICRGTSAALVGKLQSGKTTFMTLIHRLYDPQVGTICLNGMDLKEINSTLLRTYVGYVQQNPVLFGAILEECITCHSVYEGQVHMETVAKIVGMHSFIMELPEKYNTRLTENLSMEQRQRLALARILYRKPQVLLMDNALSALSLDDEETIYNSIKSANSNLTILIITNNLQILRKVDKVLYLYKGDVNEYSTIDEIIYVHPEAKEIMCNRNELRDNIDPKSVIQCKHDGPNCKTILPYTPSFLGRSYQELFRTELVRIGRYPAFFQITDIPFTDNVLQRDIAHASTMKLLYYNRNEWLQLLLAGIAAAILGFSLPIYAVLFGESLSLVAVHNGAQLQMRLDFFTNMFLVAGFVSGICTIIQGYMVTVAGSKLTTRIRKYVLKRILQRDMEWFDCETNDFYKICTLLRDNAPKLQQACGQRLVFFVQAITSLTVSVVLSMLYNWKLGLATLIFTPLTLLTLRYNNKLVLQRTFSTSASLNKIKEIILEATVKIRCVMTLTLEDAFLVRYQEELNKMLTNHPNLCLQAFIHGCCVALPTTAYAMAMFYGGYMLKNNEIEIGKVFKVVEATILGTLMVGHLISFTPNIMKAQLSAVKLLKIIETPISSSNKRCKKIIEGNITFKNVLFQHPYYLNVPKLLNFNLQICSGDCIALVGRLNSGISIPIQLLLYFYKSTLGEIYLDKTRQSSFHRNHLKKQLSLINSESIFFERSVADNIAYGNLRRNVRMDEIIAAAKAAYLHDFITSLSNGYKTILYRSQVNFTISQKVRLSLARALIRNPKILLFENLQRAENDEAEMILRKAIFSAALNRTCIVSSYDPLSAVQIFSRIIVIDQGCIVEIGNHEQLLAAQGYYANLYKEV